MLDAERNRVFESWIEAHKAILFKVARVYGATHSDREDLFQEIAPQVWHSVEAYRGDCAATTWIYRVALNTALAWRRKERKHSQGREDIECWPPGLRRRSSMDFDQMLETWRAQSTAPPYDVNRDALRQTLQAEEARVRRGLRTRRRGLWFLWIFGTGMAVWAGFWIAITIANGWPAIYAIAAGVSFCMFALAAGASWVGRGREPERKFGNTLQEEVSRSLALVDYQLSITRRWIISTLGMASLLVGVALFSWTLAMSQDNFHRPDSSSGFWLWYAVVLVVVAVRASYKMRDEMRKATPKLELRQRHLRELLAALDARE
jgi:RNA polymerase sigma factor (sigma-70 family)